MLTTERIVVIGAGPVGRLVKIAMPQALVFDANPLVEVNPWVNTQYFTKKIQAPGLVLERVVVVVTVDGHLLTRANMEACVSTLKPGTAELARHWTEMRSGDSARPTSTLIQGYRIRSWPPLGIIPGARVDQVRLAARELVLETGDLVSYDVLVSTIPLPVFAALAGPGAYALTASPVILSAPEIRDRSQIPDLVARLEPQGVIHLDYLGDPETPDYRQAYTKGWLTRERVEAPGGEELAAGETRLIPGRMDPADEASVWALRQLYAQQRVYVFGRYGAWKPHETLDETWAQIVDWKGRV